MDKILTQCKTAKNTESKQSLADRQNTGQQNPKHSLARNQIFSKEKPKHYQKVKILTSNKPKESLAKTQNTDQQEKTKH